MHRTAAAAASTAAASTGSQVATVHLFWSATKTQLILIFLPLCSAYAFYNIHRDLCKNLLIDDLCMFAMAIVWLPFYHGFTLNSRRLSLDRPNPVNQCIVLTRFFRIQLSTKITLGLIYIFGDDHFIFTSSSFSSQDRHQKLNK